jgi:hypothetical protein
MGHPEGQDGLSLYQYLERLWQRAADHSASKEDACTQVAVQMAAMSEGEVISGQGP